MPGVRSHSNGAPESFPQLLDIFLNPGTRLIGGCLFKFEQTSCAAECSLPTHPHAAEALHVLSPGIVLPPLACASAAYAHSSRPSAISALGTPLPPRPTRRPGERSRTAPCARQQPAPRCCRHPTSPRQRGGADGRATADATEPKWATQARWPHDGTAEKASSLRAHDTFDCSRAKDSGADTSRERGIDEISAW